MIGAVNPWRFCRRLDDHPLPPHSRLVSKPVNPMPKNKAPKKARSATNQNSLAPLLYETPLEIGGTLDNEFPIDQIMEDPENARTHYDPIKLRELAASIQTNGLIEPIVIRRFDDTDTWMVTVGHRRLRAVRDILHGKTIRVLKEEGRTAAGVRIANTVENTHRDGLTPYEEAKNLQRSIDAGLTIDQAAQALGISHTTAKARLRILRLPEPIGQRVGRGWFSQEHADVAAKAAAIEGGLDAIAPLLEVGKDDEPMDAYTFRNAVVQKLGGRTVNPADWKVTNLAAHSPKLRKALKAAPRVDFGDGYQMKRVVATPELKEALKEAKAKEAEARKDEPQARQVDYRFEQQVRDRAGEILMGLVPAKVQGLLDFDTRSLALVAGSALSFSTGDAAVFAEPTGIPLKALEKIATHRATLEDFEQLAKDNREGLIRLLVADALRANINEGYAAASKATVTEWLGMSHKEAEKQARKELKAESKAAAAGAAAASTDDSPAASDPAPDEHLEAEVENDQGDQLEPEEAA